MTNTSMAKPRGRLVDQAVLPSRILPTRSPEARGEGIHQVWRDRGGVELLEVSVTRGSSQ